MNHPFKCKNGRKFRRALIKAGNGDDNVAMMFMDNLDFELQEEVVEWIELGDFRMALLFSFVWGKSPEGHGFWYDISEHLGGDNGNT